MKESVSLILFFNIIKKRIKVIILSVLIGVGISGFITFFVVTPKYSSYSQLIVRLPADNANGNGGVNDVNFNLMMINTYKDMITKSNLIAEEAHKRLVEEKNFQGSVADVKNMLEVTQEQNSQMFSIKATTTTPYQARDVANIVTDVFQKQAQQIMTVDKISVISNATINTKPVSPNRQLNLIIGLLVGLLVGVALAFIKEFFDRTIKSKEFITEYLELPILGDIPHISIDKKKVQAPIVNISELNSDESFDNNSNITQTIVENNNYSRRKSRKRL